MPPIRFRYGGHAFFTIVITGDIPKRTAGLASPPSQPARHGPTRPRWTGAVGHSRNQPVDSIFIANIFLVATWQLFAKRIIAAGPTHENASDFRDKFFAGNCLSSFCETAATMFPPVFETSSIRRGSFRRHDSCAVRVAKVWLVFWLADSASLAGESALAEKP